MSPSGTSSKQARESARDKVAQVRREQQRQQRRRRSLVLWIGGTLLVLQFAGVVTYFGAREQKDRTNLDAVATYKVEQGHTGQPVEYAQTPPAGGPHAPVWLNCGIYNKPVPSENAVHSMEHGAVWITYRSDLPAAQVDTLKKAVPDTYVVLSPFAGLKSPVVASAWGRQLPLTGVSDPRLSQFIRQFRQGPQTPEPGALCSGGTDGTSPAAGMGS